MIPLKKKLQIILKIEVCVRNIDGKICKLQLEMDQER